MKFADGDADGDGDDEVLDFEGNRKKSGSPKKINEFQKLISSMPRLMVEWRGWHWRGAAIFA